MSCHDHVQVFLRIPRATAEQLLGQRKGQHTHDARGVVPPSSTAMRATSPCAAQCLDMMSRRDHSQRQRGTHAKSLRRPARAHTHTHSHTHTHRHTHRAGGGAGGVKRADPVAGRPRSSVYLGHHTWQSHPRHVRTTAAELTCPRARHHNATRRGRSTVARIWWHGASEHAG